MKTVLLTSVGGLTGTYLTKLLKAESKYRIVGTDMNEMVALKHKLDAFYRVPSNNAENFMQSIHNIIIKEDIDYLIPVSSYDMKIFSKTQIKDLLKATRYLVVDESTNQTLHYKDSCYSYLKKLGINVPRIYESEVQYPAVIKPIDGSGSKNVQMLYTDDDLRYYLKRYDKQYIVSEFLSGKEYTVDCLFDRNGLCKGFNIRKRERTISGGAVVTINDYTYINQVEEVIVKLEDAKKIVGPVNFQFKVQEDGNICVFDFNTRFASGGLALTVKSGFNIPMKLLDLLENKEVENWKPDRHLEGLTMIRYYEEGFI